jgi:mannose-6-phosphate isomerase-like protein (cupin superfamily)
MQVGEPVIVEKGWGCEVIFASEDLYCGKMMCFHANEKTSMHFHAEKTETFYVLEGEFIITTLNTKDASRHVTHLTKGQTMKIPRLVPHQIEAKINGEIIEVSTHDCPEDSYRVEEGSSQRNNEKKHQDDMEKSVMIDVKEEAMKELLTHSNERKCYSVPVLYTDYDSDREFSIAQRFR